MNEDLRVWQLLLAEAAGAALLTLNPDDQDQKWRPNAEPFWPATIQPPCVIVAPGGPGDWMDPLDSDTFCTVPAYYSLVVVAGTPSRQAEELLPMMVGAIMANLATEVMANPLAQGLWGAPTIGTVGTPQEIPGAAIPKAPIFLGAPIEVTLKIPAPSPG